MSRRVQRLLFAALVVVLVAGFARLYSDRLSRGDVFPPYSSLRADPLGTRAYFEALSELPGVSVRRWLKPLDRLALDGPATLVLPGMTREAWASITRGDAEALDAAARSGSRVVVLFAAELSADPSPADKPSRTSPDSARKKKDAEDRAKREAELPERLRRANWAELWGLEVKCRRMVREHDAEARRADHASPTLPARLRWGSEVCFGPPGEAMPASSGKEALESAGWRAVYTRAGLPVMVERQRGRGSLVLAADAYFASNEALQDKPSVALLSWLIGPNPSVFFSEAHLGVREDPGLAALARRYGLTGAAGLLILVAALAIWKRAALFVPPPAETDEVVLTYQQTAGLEALLRRAVPPGDLVATCLTEWGQGARATDIARAKAALAELPAAASVSERYNAIVRALKKRL